MIVPVLLLSLFLVPSIAESSSFHRIWQMPPQIRSNRELQGFFHESERFESGQYIFQEHWMRSLYMSMVYESTTHSPTPSVILNLEGGVTQDPTLDFTNVTVTTSTNSSSSKISSLLGSSSNDANSINAGGHGNSVRRTATGAMVGFVVATVALLLGVWRNRIRRTRFRRTHFYADPIFAVNSKQCAPQNDEINLMMLDREYVVAVV
jgi:hypothetical protein